MVGILKTQFGQAAFRRNVARLRLKPVLRTRAAILLLPSIFALCFDGQIASADERYRVIVSTDIGGTDPDDFQSMVHLLVYADVLDIEGLVASPFGKGRKQDILDVISCYEKDFANLKTYSDDYPTPDELRSLTKQGENERAPHCGYQKSTEGSRHIIKCAKSDDDRPLHVLVWGGLEDVAQALHDAPEILSKLRVYWIGGPNKKWSPDAYQYVVDHHPELWMIESNATYRGWFVGGNQADDLGNKAFVKNHVKGKGSLGDFFVSQKPEIKMGDTPSVAWLLKGTPNDPAQPGWGGQYVPAWKRPIVRLDRLPTSGDQMEVFGVLELSLPIQNVPAEPHAYLKVENQKLIGCFADGRLRFRFCPKAAKKYNFTIESNAKSIDGATGTIKSLRPSPQVVNVASDLHQNWWTDDPSPTQADKGHHGAKTVNRWREGFLRDFSNRMLRCNSPKRTKQNQR